MARFTLLHLYPDLMNLYGDRGNLVCLQKRLEWMGHESMIKRCALGDRLEVGDADLLFMGGGSDREQELVYQDLLGKREELWQSIQSGMPALFICGGYQLLGDYYRGADGTLMPGLGFFHLHTEARPGRLIGNIMIETDIVGSPNNLVGFENHGGRTYLDDPELKPLGKVIRGYGNNGQDETEGMQFLNMVGTYLHGPLLPKNPALADFFIQAMAQRRGILLGDSLDDTIEKIAHRQVERMILSS